MRQQEASMAPDGSRKYSKRLSTPEAANYLGLRKSTLDKYRITGKGPSWVKFGRRVVYDSADLDAWIASHTVGAA